MNEPSAKYLPKALHETEVGPTSFEWKIFRLDEITDRERPISYGIVQTGPRIQNGVPCLRVVDIRDGKIQLDDLITTSEEISNAYRRTKLREGDLVVPLRGKVGECAQVAKSLANANLTRGVALVAVLPKYSAAYCKQFFSSSRSRARLNGAMNGSALQEVPIAALRSFKIALPPTLDEQDAIAKTLADADALIDSLEQLLTKKRQIKQGAMQELLTGKRRLLQNGEAWRQVPLGSLGRWSGGMTPSMARVDYWSPAEVPWLSSGDIKTAQLSESAKYVSKAAVRDRATTVVPANSVVVVMRSGILRKHLPVGITLKPMAINQDLKAIQPNTEVVAEFLLHAFPRNHRSPLAVSTPFQSLISRRRTRSSMTTTASISIGD